MLRGVGCSCRVSACAGRQRGICRDVFRRQNGIARIAVRGGTDKNDTLTKHPWAGVENFYLYGFMPKFGTDDLELASEMSTAQDCTADLHKITKPLLILHSKIDPIHALMDALHVYDLSEGQVQV